VPEPGNAQAGLWAGCINSWIGVKRAQRMPGRPRCRSEKKTRTHFEHEREPTHLGWHRVDIPATIPLGWEKGHPYSMVDCTSRFPESTNSVPPAGGLNENDERHLWLRKGRLTLVDRFHIAGDLLMTIRGRASNQYQQVLMPVGIADGNVPRPAFRQHASPGNRYRNRTVGSDLPYSCFPFPCLILTSTVLTDHH
jgi:hypothetical protein